ncbi:MAG TPA: hypothetical protein VFO62_05395 [Candidatus Binatia bacterium]|nr:hypothetical protein [Candidatus Binatia bacterium]
MNHGRTGTTYEGTKVAVRNAYGTTFEALQSGYACTIAYGKEHPQRFGLVTFAAGLGAGTLIAVSRLASRHTRTERIASPVIDVVAEIARAFVRR